MPGNNYTYAATVVRIIDGDTLVVTIDLGFRITYTNAVRIYGINAPEARTPEGPAATAALAALCIVPNIIVHTHAPGTNAGGDKYGRWLAEVHTLDGINIGDTMIANGHAVPYFG